MGLVKIRDLSNEAFNEKVVEILHDMAGPDPDQQDAPTNGNVNDEDIQILYEEDDATRARRQKAARRAKVSLWKIFKLLIDSCRILVLALQVYQVFKD